MPRYTRSPASRNVRVHTFPPSRPPPPTATIARQLVYALWADAAGLRAHTGPIIRPHSAAPPPNNTPGHQPGRLPSRPLQPRRLIARHPSSSVDHENHETTKTTSMTWTGESTRADRGRPAVQQDHLGKIAWHAATDQVPRFPFPRSCRTGRRPRSDHERSPRTADRARAPDATTSPVRMLEGNTSGKIVFTR